MDTIFPPLPEWFWYPIAFLYGAIVGSFLNVLIYRLPLTWTDKNLTIGGKSFCPRCKNYLKPYHNVPLLGFLFLRGRCAFCKVRISWRYPMVELVTACLWTALYHRVSGREGVTWVDFVFQALFASVLIAMVFIDLDHFLAPDELNIVGFLLGLFRDIACLVLAYYGGTFIWQQFAPMYSYFGWLPRALPGAITYGGVMLLVSFAGFVYYARRENESLGAVARRFLADEEEQPQAGMAVVGPTSAPLPVASLPEDQQEESDDPPRLLFSPGFLALLSVLFLSVATGPWALLAFVIPFAAFLLFSRKPGAGVGEAARRFFWADDQAGLPDDSTEPAVKEKDHELIEQMKAEAEEFAREAETGAAGGMGLGDVKLGLAIGAMLGPGMALLSLLFATGLGAGTGLFLAARHKRDNLRLAVPFVPFMAAGAIFAMLFGNQFIGWYLHVSGLDKEPEPAPIMAPVRHRTRP